MKDLNKNTCGAQHKKKIKTNMVKLGAIVATIGIIILPSFLSEMDTSKKDVLAASINTSQTIKYNAANFAETSQVIDVNDTIEEETTEYATEVDNWINHIPSTEQEKIRLAEYQKKADYYKALYTPIVEEPEPEVIIASATTKNNDAEVISYDEPDDAYTYDVGEAEAEEAPAPEDPEIDATSETDSDSDADSDSNSDMSYYGCLELTAYTWTGNPCADGVFPSSGYTVACNNSDLWHKWIYIEGMGTYYVHDTGGMACGVIDIYMDSYDACIQFGRQSANVYVLN